MLTREKRVPRHADGQGGTEAKWAICSRKALCFSPAVLPSPEHEEGRQLWVQGFCLQALRKSQLENTAGAAQSSGVSQVSRKVEAVLGEVEGGCEHLPKRKWKCSGGEEQGSLG